VAASVAARTAVAGETADAAGVVPEGAVADSIVVLGGVGGAPGATVAWPNTFVISMLNIPISVTVRFLPLVWMHPVFAATTGLKALTITGRSGALTPMTGEGLPMLMVNEPGQGFAVGLDLSPELKDYLLGPRLPGKVVAGIGLGRRRR
jgi:hypothetical protein